MTARELYWMRRDTGLSITRLADLLDMDVKHLRRIESGQRALNRRTEYAIRYVLENHKRLGSSATGQLWLEFGS